MRGTLLHVANLWLIETHEDQEIEGSENLVYFLKKEDYSKALNLKEFDIVDFEVDETGLIKVAKLL